MDGNPKKNRKWRSACSFSLRWLGGLVGIGVFWFYWPLKSQPIGWGWKARMKGTLSPGLLSDPEKRRGGSCGFFLGCPHDSDWHDRKRGRHAVPWVKITYLMGPFPIIQKWRLGLGDAKTLLVAFEMLTEVIVITAIRPAKCFFCIISF